MIDAADMVVTILTKSSLASPEVRDELTRAHVRGKRIIALVSDDAEEKLIPWFIKDDQQIKYSRHHFNQALDKIISVIKNENSRLDSFIHYCSHKLSEKENLMWFFGGIIIVNLGVLFWHFFSRVVDWDILIPLKGFWPPVWGVGSNWSIIVTIYLIIRWRFGKLRFTPIKWGSTILFFLLLASLSATIFYNSGIDELLESSKLPVRAIELFSTTAWSLILSTITISPFVVFCNNFNINNVFYRKFLLWTIITTFFFAILFLVAYFIFHLPDDKIRGIFAGVGMRCGMFFGLYFSALKTPINCKNK
jgi:hypothetical protein